MKTVSKKLLSLLLVAILLVSALPFQAFAENVDTEPVATDAVVTDPAPIVHDSTHTMSGWIITEQGTHKRTCTFAGCTYSEENAHSFVNGACSVCTYACTHGSTKQEGGYAATCVNAGKEADTFCAICGTKLADGAVIPATGVHNYVNGQCTGCSSTQAGAAHILTLDANGGTVNGGSSLIVNVNEYAAISVLPDAYREGYTFAGWFVGDTQIRLGQAYNFTSDVTAVAKWTEQTYLLTVRRVLNGDSSTAKTIYTAQVTKGTNVLDYLKANVTATVQYETSITPGFSWENNYWYDFSGKQPLTSQATIMDQAQTVFVNFKSNAYTLYFNANGGTVTPTYKSVYFGSKVGTLPTPIKSGSVFQGWKDSNGVLYTADTVYQVAGDTTLTAVWQDEALVILYVYINGNFSSCDRMILMDGFVQNSNIRRSDVVAQIQKYYTASSGYLNVAGLFDEAGWASYKANTSKAGVDNIAIDQNKTNKIYVMVTNATTGSTIVNGTTNNGTTNNGTTNNGPYWVSTGNGTGYWVYPDGTIVNGSSNPKTGDTAMIGTAATIMVLAAAALVTVLFMNKKKAN